MGYSAEVTEADFIIPAARLDDLYVVLCALNDYNGLKSGRNTNPAPDRGATPDRWFAGMTWNYPDTCSDAAEVLNMAGFDTVTTFEGDLEIIGYYGEKVRDEDKFLMVAALCADEGSYLIWQGEDGDVWRHRVVNSRLLTEEGRITFESREEDPINFDTGPNSQAVFLQRELTS